MNSSRVIETVYELEDTGNTCASQIANSIGGSVVDVIEICGQLKKEGLIEDIVGGYGLTEAGLDRMEALTA